MGGNKGVVLNHFNLSSIKADLLRKRKNKISIRNPFLHIDIKINEAVGNKKRRKKKTRRQEGKDKVENEL